MQSAPAGLNRGVHLVKVREQAEDKVHTCNIGVRTEIKRTIVVSGRVGTVGRNILPDFPGEIEVGDHVLRDRTVVQFEGLGVEPIVVVRESEALDVGRVDLDVTVVSHVA